MSHVPPVAAIADVLAARGLGGWLTPPLVPFVAPTQPLRGTAVTVTLRAEPAGTGLAPVHELLSGDLTGAVVVLAGADQIGGAIWGEILSRAAQRAGALGVLVDGCVRDRASMAAEGVPVYARSECVVGPAGRASVVATGEPVVIGTVLVAPGDVVVIDGGGVVCLTDRVADDVLSDALAYAAAEAAVLRDLAAGHSLHDAYRHKRAVVEGLHSGGGR